MQHDTESAQRLLKWVLLGLFVAGVLTGCGQTAPYFVPQTAVGAQCNEECGRDRRTCHRTPESSAECEKANAQCVADCKQLEREMIVD